MQPGLQKDRLGSQKLGQQKMFVTVSKNLFCRNAILIYPEDILQEELKSFSRVQISSKIESESYLERDLIREMNPWRAVFWFAWYRRYLIWNPRVEFSRILKVVFEFIGCGRCSDSWNRNVIDVSQTVLVFVHVSDKCCVIRIQYIRSIVCQSVGVPRVVNQTQFSNSQLIHIFLWVIFPT